MSPPMRCEVTLLHKTHSAFFCPKSWLSMICGEAAMPTTTETPDMSRHKSCLRRMPQTNQKKILEKHRKKGNGVMLPSGGSAALLCSFEPKQKAAASSKNRWQRKGRRNPVHHAPQAPHIPLFPTSICSDAQLMPCQ